MDYNNIFQNATKLSQDFLINEIGIDLELKTSEAETVFKNYYYNIINAVANMHFAKLTREQIEEMIADGCVQVSNIFVGSWIESVDERQYLFLLAQAKQLEYDIQGGRGSMIRGEDGKYDMCRDTWDALYSLGLVNNGTLFKE